MNRDDVIRLALEAGRELAVEWEMSGLAGDEYGDCMYADFAADVAVIVADKVAAADRNAVIEECANACENAGKNTSLKLVCSGFAEAIRALKTQAPAQPVGEDEAMKGETK